MFHTYREGEGEGWRVRGGGWGGGVEKIVKYGGMTDDRSCGKLSF